MDAGETRRRQRLVRRWRASGSPAREFAAAHGITASQLYEWARAAKPAAAPSAGAIAFTEVRARKESPGDPMTAAAIEIEIRGHVVRVRVGADLDLLEAVLAMVARC